MGTWMIRKDGRGFRQISEHWVECRAIPDEEIFLPAVQSGPVDPCEPDAVARREAVDHVWPTICEPFDQIARVLPVDRQPFVNGSQDLSQVHRSLSEH